MHSPLILESEDRENSLEGCYSNRSPWRAWLSTSFYSQACSDLERQCLLRDGDEGDHTNGETHATTSQNPPSVGSISDHHSRPFSFSRE